MVADDTGRSSAPSTTRLRLRGLVIVVAVIAVLTAGWPLLNFAVANRQALASGAKVTIGSQSAGSGSVTVGHGWFVQPAQSNPALEYLLRKDAVLVDIRHISLIDRHQATAMWRGMQHVLSITYPGSRLSAPVRTTFHGRPAMTGIVSGPHLVGTATIVLGPSREFAIAMLALAPRHTSTALRAAARQVVLSLMFAGPGQ